MSRIVDDLLRATIVEFVDACQAPSMRRFKDTIAVWHDLSTSDQLRDENYTPVLAQDLAATAQLPILAKQTSAQTKLVFDTFHKYSRCLNWEQSYSQNDAVVGRDMLEGYAFAEIFGAHGPWRSDRMRAGIGIWGPHINYPVHRHRAEEIYVVLAGEAGFYVAASVDGDVLASREDDREYQIIEAAGTVLVPSMHAHSLRTFKRPLAVLYIWQHGDMREKSYFLTA